MTTSDATSPANPASPAAPAPGTHDSSIIDTLQSLIVAFVLAMTFRGFVTEGFVIPTGSMAPTLMGQHLLLHSKQTGAEFAVGLDQSVPATLTNSPLVDPMLGPAFRRSGPTNARPVPRMGDRILVLKCLYPFWEPQRYDVVVFKNPTEPVGDSANYIKRLIGLPNEQIWLADGDVFSKRQGEDAFQVRRKTEHVQRAVWQHIYNSDYLPIDPDKLNDQMRDTGGMRYDAPPWSESEADSGHWSIKGRRDWECDTAQPTTLEWSVFAREINDWTAYNMLAGQQPAYQPVSDVRVGASITARQRGLTSTFELRTRNYVFEWTLTQDRAVMRMRPVEREDGWTEVTAPLHLPEPGRVFDVEFWHADQAMSMFINGRAAFDKPLEYDWSPLRRLQLETGAIDTDHIETLLNRAPQVPQLRWRFSGSPVTLSRVRLDRDLYYRHEMLTPNRKQGNPPLILGHAFGTNPDEILRFGPDSQDVALSGGLGPDQFMMCGDNSQMSLDSRLWGNAAPLIQHKVDNHPFTVHRKLLLGKAWVVYFPAPFALNDAGQYPVVPDFGRLRFIR